MCGILGITVGVKSNMGKSKIIKLLKDLFILSEVRGKEAAGLSMKYENKVYIRKSPVPAHEFIKSKGFKECVSKISFSKYIGKLTFIGHSRLVTNGDKRFEDNNQPVEYGDIVGVHNGIIVNVDRIFNEYTDLERKTELDSESIMALINKFYIELGDFCKATTKTFEIIEGAANIGFLSKLENKVVICSNTGSLYYLYNYEKQVFLFASESYILNRFLKKNNLSNYFSDSDIIQLKSGTGLLLDTETFEIEQFNFELNSKNILSEGCRNIPIVQKIKVESNLDIHPKGVKRCSKCVLPETMPFIEFDNDGVCNYCKDYTPMSPMGWDELDRFLSRYRGDGSKPDCVVTLSGGRDSSYCLHILKKEFGMTPLTLTYDWGMVTDLARRNQARMTGKLGIEHILISADITKKRKNIGKNVKAWLKKPDLGMIPLFMAGDKLFFYYFNKIKKQYNIPLVTLSVNPIEKTDFKTGFCNIKHGNKVHFYNTSVINKLNILFYYLQQYLGNPAYLNSSLLDTFKAYMSSYFIPHDYINIYDYILWDEDKINSTLINEYSWEVAEDSDSTWRIGDGTAPFYNYIYFKVAGFTENDTFRSNQIREGYITRDQALTLLKHDNKPRYDSIKEYLDLIGLNFDETLKIIDNIPTLY